MLEDMRIVTLDGDMVEKSGAMIGGFYRRKKTVELEKEVDVKSLEEKNESNVYNMGIGRGYSNKEVIQEVERFGNLKVNVKFGPRREGDANALFASNTKIKKVLGWNPKYDLTKIIETAFAWHKLHPNGYQK